MFAEDDCRPISALQHLLFCERQCALIHVEQLWAENVLTITGKQLHERADGGRPTARKNKPRTTRSLMLRSLVHGLYGKADVVEFLPSAPDDPQRRPRPFPVEYKRGKPKANRCDEVQLCAQALCLEEMLGVDVPAGALFYGVTKRRVDVAIDAGLRSTTLAAIARLHEMLDGRQTPRARREKKCDRCSLLHLCMPETLDGSESASRYLERSLTLVLADTLVTRGVDS